MNTAPPNFGGTKAPPDDGRFARQLGEFMMNCGYLEFHSYAWLLALSPGFKLPADSGNMGLSDRICWVLRQIKTLKIPTAFRTELRDFWKEAKSVAETRNMIAHGPMMWGHNPDGSLFGAVPSIKNAILGKPTRLIEYDDIVQERLKCANVVLRLQKALDRMGQELGIHPPPSTEQPDAP